jgi:hypothetical protein
VKITLQGIPDAPPGKQYYAWLRINSENLFPIGWPLTPPPQNGSLSSTYQRNNLLSNNPRQFLITVETAGTNPIVANNIPSERRYYASLPPNIHNLATFDIRPCPQGGSNNICVS